jgi:7-cyano-7-deazaguanine synthase
MKQAVLSLSGGMDSSTLLLHLLAHQYKVTALSFDYGQKHRVELERAQQLVDYINDMGAQNNNIPEIKYQVIKLDGLTSLLDSALVEGGDDVPEGHYEEDNMKATVVPNRNKIFSSLIQSVALSIANKTESAVKIAMGIHAGDHAIYPDCRQEFRDADYKAFAEGNWNAQRVGLYTPYLNGDKFDILKDGESCCKCLNIDFNEVYKRTNTSYKPIQITTKDELGYLERTWYSDYKSASSVERIEAFIKLKKDDPVSYADESGPVNYRVAKVYVKNLLSKHNKKKSSKVKTKAKTKSTSKPNMNNTIDTINNM